MAAVAAEPLSRDQMQRVIHSSSSWVAEHSVWVKQIRLSRVREPNAIFLFVTAKSPADVNLAHRRAATMLAMQIGSMFNVECTIDVVPFEPENSIKIYPHGHQ